MEQHPEVKQTHVGVVFLTTDRVWKMKKSVDTGFLDFTNREDRERVCHREVELNRRLAPDVYHGVADLYGPDGEPCEHFVVMDRMPDHRRLSTLITDPRIGMDEVRQVARSLCRFHRDADRSEHINSAATPEAVRQRWTNLFAQLRDSAGRLVDGSRVDSAERRAMDYLDGRSELFTERVDGNHIVDGHGDILAEDIFCLPDGPRILDCLEFDDRIRWLDQLDDVAFLAMDLEYRHRGDLARELIATYRQCSDDTAPPSLVDHYIGYRALVRARVAAVRAGQIGQDRPEGEPMRQEVAGHLDLTITRLASAQVRLVLVGGLPGTGKSTLATHLSRQLGFITLSSDRVRKELAGLPEDEPVPAARRDAIYRPEMTDRVYGELILRARELLSRGYSVIIDASWSDGRHRRRAHDAARRTHSALVALRCHTARPTASKRLRERAPQASDADENVATTMAAEADRWPEATALDTSGSERDAARHAIEIIYARS